MKWMLIMAWRNLWRNKRRTWITISSVIFAVALSTFLESMDRGSQEVMVSNTVRFSTGYVQLQDTLFQEEPSIDNTLLIDESLMQQLQEELPNLSFWVPRLETYALAAGDERSQVAFISGIDPYYEDKFNGIKSRVKEGTLLEEGEDRVVMGAGLADWLGLSIGDTLVLLGQGFHGVSAAGKYVLGGLIHHPVPELNERLVYMHVTEAQLLFGAYDRFSGLIAVPQRSSRHIALAESLKGIDALSDYTVYTWEELQPELVRTIAFDKAGTLIFLLILYLVIAFGIFGTVLTMTLEREKEFGILISMGMHRRKLSFVIWAETLAINFLGVVLGILVSFPIILYFYFNPISLGEDLGALMAEYGMEAVMKFSMEPSLFMQQGVIIFFISMLIVLYPLIRIQKLDVLSASRK